MGEEQRKKRRVFLYRKEMEGVRREKYPGKLKKLRTPTKPEKKKKQNLAECVNKRPSENSFRRQRKQQKK